eukprot:11644771-Alexandrium_andersonii.AAC.1
MPRLPMMWVMCVYPTRSLTPRMPSNGRRCLPFLFWSRAANTRCCCNGCCRCVPLAANNSARTWRGWVRQAGGED